MTFSPKLRSLHTHDAAPTEAELLLPWLAVGSLDSGAEAAVAAATIADPFLADDLAAARAEQAEVAALGEALGQPSRRPMLALFAAIDGEAQTAGNVTRLVCDRRWAPPASKDVAVEFHTKKIRRR